MADIQLQALLDGMGQAALLFNSDGKLVMENGAARALFGRDMDVLRGEGWRAALVLFNTRVTDPSDTLDAARDKAEISGKPVRFHTYRSGEYLPCWASVVKDPDGALNTLIAIELPDWGAFSELVDKFTNEVKDAVESTQGHLEIINQSMKRKGENDTVEAVGKRISGFTRLISTHMYRIGRYVGMLERLELLRTGKLVAMLRERRRKLDVTNYMEDFIETLDESNLLDPETEQQDIRSRIALSAVDGLLAGGSNVHLTVILRDVVRNAIMYSMKASPIKIKVSASGGDVQWDVTDEGIGVRAKEVDAVFAPFKRARQPQIMSEFGYGLSLYLCKHEIEAMGGKMWFKSEENVGSTFSFTLPGWKDDAGG